MLREWHLASGYSEQGRQEGWEMLIMTFTVTFSCDFLRRVKTTEMERWGYVWSFPLIKLRLRHATAEGNFSSHLLKSEGEKRTTYVKRLGLQWCPNQCNHWWLQYLSFSQSSQGRDLLQSCWSVFEPDKESLRILGSGSNSLSLMKSILLVKNVFKVQVAFMFYHRQIAHYYVQMCFGNHC